MEDKESYTPQEFEEGMLEYDNYNLLKTIYMGIPKPVTNKLFEMYKKGLNVSVEECEKKLPKSLIDKLGIKKVE